MSNGTEPDLGKTLAKLLRAIIALVVWGIITIFFGLYLEWALILGSFNTFNTLFYLWFILSLSALVYYYYKIWRQ